MISATLTRTEARDGGTFGHIVLPSGRTLATVELPWRDNQPRVSCIPAGSYLCRPRPYHRGGYDAIEVCDVPGRSAILFHVANWPTDVLGCIGVGLSRGVVDGRYGVRSSRAAFNRHLMPELGSLEWQLTIVEEAS